MHRTIALFVVLVTIALEAPAAVMDTAASGFTVRDAVNIEAPPAKVFAALVHDISRWWNPAHTFSGDAKNLSLEARPGGCFCERIGSGGAEHMRVVNLQPDQLLRLSGALGPLQGSGLAGSLTWKLTAAGSATTLEMTYSVGGYMQGGFEKIAPAVDGVLAEQVQRLKAFAEHSGHP